MFTLLLTGHILIAVILILIVLLQSARGTDIAAAFGGMGSQTAFGPRGTATFLSKATVVLAVLFMVTSISLAILSNRQLGGGSSVLGKQEAATPSQPAPQPTSQTPPAPGTPPIQVDTSGLPPGVKVETEVIPKPKSPSETEKK